jgi:ribonuclease BN (tRNA processing enzyme)
MRGPGRRALALAGYLTGVAALAPSCLASQPPTRIVMLGSGTPNPDPERSGPAVAIVAGGRAYLVDAGAGLMRRAEAAREKYQMDELRANRLDLVFITHLHSDHTIGLPDLIHTGWVADRPGPLRVYGPPGIREMAQHLTEAWKEDIRIRTEGDQPHTAGWRIEATEVKPGVVYRDSTVTVTAIPVPHTNWEHAFGYRFVTQDRTIVVSGDTRGTDALADACNGCDVLLHEVYSAKGLEKRTPEWQKYHRGSHTSTVDLARIATRAHPKLLLLYHQLNMGVTDQELIDEIRAAGYQGEIRSSTDLEIY